MKAKDDRKKALMFCRQKTSSYFQSLTSLTFFNKQSNTELFRNRHFKKQPEKNKKGNKQKLPKCPFLSS